MITNARGRVHDRSFVTFSDVIALSRSFLCIVAALVFLATWNPRTLAQNESSASQKDSSNQPVCWTGAATVAWKTDLGHYATNLH